jgi:uncharacterized protein YhfF
MIGKKTGKTEAFWQLCCDKYGLLSQDYCAYTFGNPEWATYHDQLIDLVLNGQKQATTHLDIDFDMNAIRRREVGDYWVVLNQNLEPRCLIQVTDIEIKPFSEVDVSLAIREGEGDLSLAYWAKVHEDYYTQQCMSLGVEFQEELLVVVEGFKLIEAA